MSTNIYRYQENIWYSKSSPSKHWGWFISTSTDSARMTWFDTKKKQDEFIKLVGIALDKVFPDRPVFPGYPNEWEAMYVACVLGGTGDDDWVMEDLDAAMSDELTSFLNNLADDETGSLGELLETEG